MTSNRAPARNTSRAATPRRTTPGRQRLAARLVHLFAAVALGAFVYAPAALVEPTRLLLQVVAFPAASITGLYLWKQAAIRRWLARRPG